MSSHDWQPMQLGLDGAEVPHELGEQVREPDAVQLALGEVGMGTVDAPSLFDAEPAETPQERVREAGRRARAAHAEWLDHAAKVTAVHPQTLVERHRAGLDVVTGEPGRAVDLLDAEGSWIGPGAWYVVGYSAPEQGGSGVQWFATRADADAEATRQRLKLCPNDPKARNVVRPTDPRHRLQERARAWDEAAAGEVVHGCYNGTFAFGAAVVAATRASEAYDDANGYGPRGSDHPAAVARRAAEVERVRQAGAESEGRLV